VDVGDIVEVVPGNRARRGDTVLSSLTTIGASSRG
jgi:hypothetical protein